MDSKAIPTAFSQQPHGWGGRRDTSRSRRRRMQLGRLILCQTRRTILQLFWSVLLLLCYYYYFSLNLYRGWPRYISKPISLCKDRAGILWQTTNKQKRETIIEVFFPPLFPVQFGNASAVLCMSMSSRMTWREPHLPPLPFSTPHLLDKGQLSLECLAHLTLFGPPLVKVKRATHQKCEIVKHV